MHNSLLKKGVAIVLSALLLTSCGTMPTTPNHLPTEDTSLTTVSQNGPISLQDAGLSNLVPETGTSVESSLENIPNPMDLLAPMSVSATKVKLSSPIPAFDIAVKANQTFEFQVNAPADATVYAQINGYEYELSCSKTTNGIGTFNRSYTMPNSNGTTDLGAVTYTMNYNGQSYTLPSEGHLFSVGTNDTLLVEVKNTSATTFRTPTSQSNDDFITTLKKGTIESVTDYAPNMYRLASVGWVSASACTPITANVSLNNVVSDVSFANTPNGEQFTLFGTSHPPFRATQGTNQFAITFARTSGVPYLPTENSQLFSNGQVTTAENGSTTLTFDIANPGELWGYYVEYNGGNTILTFRPKPKIAEGMYPLAGITIVVDPGHGGSDQGAAGLGANGAGPIEKEITLSSALALKNSLEAQGATVIMTRMGDDSVSLSDRLAVAQINHADFMISLHCNSAASPTGNGVEVFYYDSISKNFAGDVASRLSSATNRSNRGGKYACYVVTLNSAAPSLLVEMGFMTNQTEYEDMQTQESMTATADAITNSVIAQLQ